MNIETTFHFLLLTCLPVFTVNAQPGALHNSMLVDLPAAKLLSRGEASAELRVFAEGGLAAAVSVGLTDRFGMGIGFGGENIIGAGKVRFYPQPSVHVEYLLFEEQYFFAGRYARVQFTGLRALGQNP